jgi:hypothetical protein
MVAWVPTLAPNLLTRLVTLSCLAPPILLGLARHEGIVSKRLGSLYR